MYAYYRGIWPRIFKLNFCILVTESFEVYAVWRLEFVSLQINMNIGLGLNVLRKEMFLGNTCHLGGFND